MKKYLIIFTLCLTACASMVGKTNYVAIGPQNLSVQVSPAKDMPVFSKTDQVGHPCSRIGFYQVQKLPKDQKVIEKEIEKIKEFAAKKGANAIILGQILNEDDPVYPINLSSYFLKYLDTLTPEDEQKIITFVNSGGIAGVAN